MSIALTLASTGGASPAADSAVWTQYRFNAARAGFNPFERELGQNNVARLRMAWSADIGSEIYGPPVVVGDTLYISSTRSGHVHALRASTGERIWSAETTPSYMESPSVGGGAVFVLAEGSLYALASSDGRRLWRRSISDLEGGFQGTPAVQGSVVYAVNSDAAAFDAESGSEIWRRGPELFSFGLSPAVAGGNVYISDQARLFALSAATGQVRWRASLPRRLRSLPLELGSDFPAVSGGRVYVDAAFGRNRRLLRLYAFNARTGARHWSAPVGRSRFGGGGPAVANAVVYYGSASGALYAFRASTGRRLWSARLGQVVSVPAVANRLVYVRAGSGLFAFNARTGKRLWSVRFPGKVLTSPVVAGGAVYVATTDGMVYRFDLPDGSAD